jgi:hypothetical protein
MKPLNTHFCWLTKVAGSFDGNHGNAAGAFVQRQSDGNWHLETRATGSFGEGRCVALACFLGDGVNDVVMVNQTGFAAIANSQRGCDVNSTATWWGDAVTVLQGFPGPGNTAGNAESASVALSTDPFAPSTVVAQDCQADNLHWIQAAASSIFVGTPSGGKLAHYTGAPFTVSGNTTLNLGQTIGNTSPTLPPDAVFCFFTHVQGKFRGAPESVELFLSPNPNDPGNELWTAKSTQGGGGSQISASGRCSPYVQFDH